MGDVPAGEARRGSAAARFAHAIVLLRYPIVVGWFAMAAFAVLALPTIREAQVGSLGDLVPADADAIEAELRSVEEFNFPVLSRTLVVIRDPDGLTPQRQSDVIELAVALNRGEIERLDGIGGALVLTNTLGRPPFSREESTTAVMYLFFPPDIGQVGRTGLAELLVETELSPPPGGTVGVTGAVPARAAQAEIISDRLPLVEALTVLLVGFAVALYFRAVGAAVLNLVVVGLAYLIAVRVVSFVGSKLGVSVPSEVEPVIVVLLFGVMTDYSIFFMSRFRTLAADGPDKHSAVERVTTELLPIVLTAGLTIIGGSAALVIAKLGFLQAFGPGMALAVAVALAVSVTFVPASLAIMGRILFWPGGAQRLSLPLVRRLRDRVGPLMRSRPRPTAIAVRRPVATAAAAAALLAVVATGIARLEPANPLIRGLPDDSEVRQAYRAAGDGFAAGVLAPTAVVVEAPGIGSMRSRLAELQRRLERQRGVAEVVGPADQPFRARRFGAVISETNDAARYVVFFNADPLSGRAITLLDRLESRTEALLEGVGLSSARASFAGDTALVGETVDKTFDDLAIVAPIIALIVFLILVAFLRAVIAPLYLLAASVLALCASLGLLTYVFQSLAGYDETTYFVPFAAAVLLVSLGSDYNVFLVGRVWREARTRPIRDAIMTGAASAARPITAAALVLAGSFALLAFIPVRSFSELAFAMSAGLMLDAFIVRTMLVPALMTLAGHWSAWPGKRMDRRGVSPPRR